MTTLSDSIRNIDSLSTKSEIILYIAAHGMDLEEKLPEDLQKKPCLLFSLANKGSIGILPPAAHSELQMDQNIIGNFLIEELRKESKPVITVLDNLKEKLYNEFNYSNYCRIKYENINKLYKNPTLKEQSEKLYQTYQRLVDDCEKGYTGSIRVINTDRLYDFHDETKSIIDIIDIRYPKKEYDINDIENSLVAKIVHGEDGSIYLKFSDVLNILFNEFEFDYVTIIDFACRVCNYDLSEDEIEKEITTGQNLKETYKNLGLGGSKKRKKNKKTKRCKSKKTKTAKKKK